MTDFRKFVTSPVGRIIDGSVSVQQDKDMDGKPLVVKNGPNAGQPTKRTYFALAIAKSPNGQHWAHEAWGAIIWAVGHAAFPQGQSDRPGFAWKITDGDSTEPNKKGKRPCDQKGYPGHWILRLSSSFIPKTTDARGERTIEASAIKTGYYAQVYFSVDGNMDGTRNPGVYLNPEIVALAGYGEEITFGADPTQVGFGAAPLPAGASAVPAAAMTAPPTAGTPAPSHTAPPPVSPPGAPPVAPAPAPVPSTAHPAVPVPPPSAPPPPAAPGRQMTAAANGVPYEEYLRSGWTDALLIQHGMMTA